MQINNVMGVTIGPGGYFLNFTQFGLQINAGHEVTVTATATATVTVTVTEVVHTMEIWGT